MNTFIISNDLKVDELTQLKLLNNRKYNKSSMKKRKKKYITSDGRDTLTFPDPRDHAAALKILILIS